MPFLLFACILTLAACSRTKPEPSDPGHFVWTGDSAPGDTSTEDTSAEDTAGADTADPGWSYAGNAYNPCVSDAQCDAGSACTTVDGYAERYCAPACEPGGDAHECDPDGTLGVEAVCMAHGRCARTCGEPDTCPDGLDCQTVTLSDDGFEEDEGQEDEGQEDEGQEDEGQEDEAVEYNLCAGAAAGTSGYYGVCSHPNVDGADCPDESTCFGGDYLGIESGICLPWCDDGTCRTAPDGTSDVTPYCYDAGLDHPMCVLLCTPETAVCPEAQYCLDFGGFGLCVPDEYGR